MADPDFAWLISRYQENNPDCIVIESTSLPLILIKKTEEERAAAFVAGLNIPGAEERELPEK